MKRHLLLIALLFVPSVASAQFAGISVADIDASTRWYTEKLGFRVTFDPPAAGGAKARVVEGGGIMVELVAIPGATTQGDPADVRRHGVFKVGFVIEHYDQFLAGLRQRQVPIALGPFPARDGQRANFIIRDNAGNMLQFFAK